MNLPELVLAYLQELEPAWSENTLRTKREHLKALSAFLPGHVGPLERQHVLAFVAQLESREHRRRPAPLSAVTVFSRVLTLRIFLTWAYERGQLLEDLSRLLHRPAPQTAPKPLGEAEVLQLIEAGPQGSLALRDRALVELFYGTGLRRAEAAHLALEDLDLSSLYVHVRRGKGLKGRIVPVPTRTAEALAAYLRVRPSVPGALFLSQRGRPLCPGALAALVAKAARQAGLERPVRPHRLRHSYATHLVRRGADIAVVQKLLGHASLASTQAYTELDVSDLRQMLTRSHPRERARR